MIPEASTFSCDILWRGANNDDYDAFLRIHEVAFPKGGTVISGGAGREQDPRQTNPEELLAAAVGACMMMTLLAVFAKSRVRIVAYRDHPEALVEFIERRNRVTKVTLRPQITVEGAMDREKFDSLIQKAHANCIITLSVKSEVVVEPTFVAA